MQLQQKDVLPLRAVLLAEKAETETETEEEEEEEGEDDDEEGGAA
jgi:hypothetical protein